MCQLESNLSTIIVLLLIFAVLFINIATTEFRIKKLEKQFKQQKENLQE